MSLFFNKTLLRLGNVLLLIGVPLMFGPSKTMGYFLQPAKARATACLGVGIILVVLLGRPILGIAMQVFGLLNLFGNMFLIKLVRKSIEYGAGGHQSYLEALFLLNSCGN